MESGGHGIGLVRDGRRGHTPECKAHLLRQIDQTKSHIGAYDQSRDQYGIFARPFGSAGNEIGKTAFVSAQTFACQVMAHQRATPMADAKLAQVTKRSMLPRSSVRPQSLSEISAHLVAACIPFGPEPQIQNSGGLDRGQFSHETNRGTATGRHWITGPVGHVFWINMPLRVIRKA